MMWRISSMLLGGFLASLAGIWVGDRTPPIIIESVSVVTPSVPPGGELKIRYTVNRVRSCGTRVQKLISDVTGKYEIAEEQEILANLRPLGNDSYISSTTIPKNFELGRANYRSARRYDCNPVHVVWPITVLVADVYFMIEGAALIEPIEVIPRR